MIYQLQNQEYDGSLPLVSILLLSYNNTEYLPESLTSIFRQSYPNIEVLIGDDGSVEFDATAIMQWVETHRTENIRNIQLVQNETNVGTVANLENLVALSKGEFLFPIAADDAMYDADVIARFYEEAEKYDEDALIFTTETELWDNKLEHRTGAFLRPDIIELIKNGTSEQMFEELAWHACMPASSFCRRGFYEKIGRLSEKYRLVEDWPAHLIAARMGVRFHYVDMPSSIKHRDGGISHNEDRFQTRGYLLMTQDCLNTYTYEVHPYESMLPQHAQKRASMHFSDLRDWYYYLLYHYLRKKYKRKERKQLDLHAWELAGINDEMNMLTFDSLRKFSEAQKKVVFFHQISRVRMIAVTVLLLVIAYIMRMQPALAGVLRTYSLQRITYVLGGILALQLISKLVIVCRQRIYKKKRHFGQSATKRV